MIDNFLSGLLGGEVVEVGIGGFTLFASVSRETNFSSQAPTTYLEDGSFVNDHIINEPVTINIEGVVSDVTVKQPQLNSFVDNLTGTLGSIGIYTGGRTSSQIGKVVAVIDQARSYIRRIDNLINQGKKILDFFGNKDPEKSIRERFIDEMIAIRESKQPISIDMPYRTLDNMIITSLVITENNTDKALTFRMTAQEIRLAQTILVEAIQIKPASGVKSQTGKQSNKGVQQGEQPNEGERSLVDYVWSYFKR